MATIAYQWTSNTSTEIPSGAISNRGQTFLCGDDSVLTSISLKLSRAGSPGIVTVELYAIDGTNFPTGPVLSTGSLDSSEIATSPAAFYDFAMSAYSLVDGTSYAVVVSVSTGDFFNHIGWRYYTTSGYSDGGLLYFTGSWTFDTDDHVFTITGDVTTVSLSGTITGTSSMSGSLVSPARNPDPADAYSSMGLDWQTFSWESGNTVPPDDEVYNVYFGTSEENLSLIVSESADISFAAAYLAAVAGMGGYSSTYYWRVDTYFQDSQETIQGDVWSFSTIAFSSPSSGGRGYDIVGGGEAEGYGGGTFGDKQLNIKTRLIGFARNTLYYENL